MSLVSPVARRLRRLPGRWLLVLPALAWFTAFFIIPLAQPIYNSFGVSQGFGATDIGGFFTLANYERMTDALFRSIFVRTMQYAVVGTFIMALLGFPVAYFLATRAGRWKYIILALIILPYWTSFLIRTYSWIILLSPQGTLNDLLRGAGVIDQPIRLLGEELMFSPWSVGLGMVYDYLPLMILPLFVSLERLDPALLEASKDLGAGRLATFRRITLPLALPGLVAGTLLVFIPLSGEYIIPALLGGNKVVLVGNVIIDQFGASRDWAFAAALGNVLALMVLSVVIVYLLALRPQLRRVT